MIAAPLAALAQAGGGDSGGGADTNNSVMAPGSNPPGAVSPGVPSSAATGADVESGAYERTNPGTDDQDRLHNRSRRNNGYGSAAGGGTAPSTSDTTSPYAAPVSPPDTTQ